MAFRLPILAAMNGEAITIEDLGTRFQLASESLERSYRELQGRVQSPAVKRIAVCHLLEGIRVFLQPVAQQKQIRIVTDCDAACFAVADPELLHRMLLNLVLNAIRETPKDGTISLSGHVVGCDVLIVVEDTGPGIQEERMARIFDPMFSTSRNGCGLGLPIVKRIVESHNGTIMVDSSRNGTKFSISLPQHQDKEVPSETVACYR